MTHASHLSGSCHQGLGGSVLPGARTFREDGWPLRSLTVLQLREGRGGRVKGPLGTVGVVRGGRGLSSLCASPTQPCGRVSPLSLEMELPCCPRACARGKPECHSERLGPSGLRASPGFAITSIATPGPLVASLPSGLSFFILRRTLPGPVSVLTSGRVSLSPPCSGQQHPGACRPGDMFAGSARECSWCSSCSRAVWKLRKVREGLGSPAQQPRLSCPHQMLSPRL